MTRGAQTLARRAGHPRENVPAERMAFCSAKQMGGRSSKRWLRAIPSTLAIERKEVARSTACVQNAGKRAQIYVRDSRMVNSEGY